MVVIIYYYIGCEAEATTYIETRTERTVNSILDYDVILLIGP